MPAGALMRLRGGRYSLGLRDSIMIAHSFKGEEFGPAQNMHGATYTVDVEFHVDELVRSDLCEPGARSSRARCVATELGEVSMRSIRWAIYVIDRVL